MFETVGGERGLYLLNEGMTDADVIRYDVVSQADNNIVIVPPALSHGASFLLCIRGAECNKDIIQNPDKAIAATTRFFINMRAKPGELNANIFEFDDFNHVIDNVKKEEHLDFTYIKINPQNLIGSEEFNELFFKKIDELENNILNGVPFNDLIKELKIQPIKRTNYTQNNKNNEIEEKIYQLRNKNKIQLIEENEFYVFFEINKINKVLPNLNDNGFKSKVTRILYEKERYEFNHELLKKINNKEFNNVSFTKLTNNNSTKIENIQLLSIKDDNKFNINSIKLLYAMPVNSFTLVNDDKNNIYIARINKIFEENISKNSEQFRNYNNQANIKTRDDIYTSYDNFLNGKYKVNVNQKTLERVKNYFN